MKGKHMKAFIIATTLISSSVFATVPQDRTFSSVGIKKVKIDNLQGDVKFVADAASQIKISYTHASESFASYCSLIIEQKDKSTVKASVIRNSTSFQGKNPCQTDFTVSLPAHLEGSLDLGQGNVTVVGLNDEFKAKVGQGNVQIDAPLKNVNVSVGQGDVRGQKISEKADISVGSGNIELSLLHVSDVDTNTGLGNIKINVTSVMNKGKVSAKIGNGNGSITADSIPARGEIEIKTGLGNVTATLPATASITADISSGIGKANNEFVSSLNAFKVDMASGAGDISIVKKK